jgi:hypothetical protein
MRKTYTEDLKDHKGVKADVGPLVAARRSKQAGTRMPASTRAD